MSKTIRYRRAARMELRDAYRWYETQRPGLGEDLLRRVEETLDRIRQNPEAFPVVHPAGVRRALIDRFPYAVFFRMEGVTAIVYAVYHAKRDPGRWQDRIK